MFAVKLFCYLIRSNNIGVTYSHYLFMRSIPRSGVMATNLYFRQTVISAIKKWLNISKLTEYKTKPNKTQHNTGQSHRLFIQFGVGATTAWIY